MVSTIDLTLSIGMFIVFIVMILLAVINFFSNYRSISEVSEYRTVAYSIYNYFFSSKGLPPNWEDLQKAPVFPSLMTDLYRLTFRVQNNGTARNATVGANITLDSTCSNKAWNTTVILYDSNDKNISFQLQAPQNFCSPQFLKNSTIVFNDTFSANEIKYYHLYYSSDKNVSATVQSMSSPNATNMTIVFYPEEKLDTISIAKFGALNRHSYETISQFLSRYGFAINVTGLVQKLTYGRTPTSDSSRGVIELIQSVQDRDGLIKTATVNIMVYRRI